MAAALSGIKEEVMRNILSFTALLALAISLTAAVRAQGIPVYDAAGYAQMLSELEQMTQDYQKQIEQLSEAIKQTNALTGSRGMGALANGNLESDLRRYLPNTWQETMNMMSVSGLNGAGLGTQGTYNDLYALYEPLKGADAITTDPSGATAQALDRRTGTTFAAIAAGEQAFNSIPRRMETYETLLTELDNTEDLKGSVDLLARISAENGFILNEMMRLNVIQIQQRAARDNQELNSYKRSHTANQYNPDTATNAFTLEE
jgi:type IV secretion system protein VirB5